MDKCGERRPAMGDRLEFWVYWRSGSFEFLLLRNSKLVGVVTHHGSATTHRSQRKGQPRALTVNGSLQLTRLVMRFVWCNELTQAKQGCAWLRITISDRPLQQGAVPVGCLRLGSGSGSGSNPNPNPNPITRKRYRYADQEKSKKYNQYKLKIKLKLKFGLK